MLSLEILPTSRTSLSFSESDIVQEYETTSFESPRLSESRETNDLPVIPPQTPVPSISLEIGQGQRRFSEIVSCLRESRGSHLPLRLGRQGRGCDSRGRGSKPHGRPIIAINLNGHFLFSENFSRTATLIIITTH